MSLPDHTPAAAAVEHAALIAALDAGDLAGLERDRATTLATTCAGCASLLEDLALLRAATAALPASPRTRDYRLTDADAARLRPSAWRRLVEWIGAPRSAVRPLAGGLAALGIAGLLLSTTPGLFGTASSLSSTGAPVVAPGAAEGAGSGADGNLKGAASSAPVPSGIAGTLEPATNPAPGTPGPTPGSAALPAPSPAAAALPAPTASASADVVTGPAPAATPGPPGFSSSTGAMDLNPKAASTDAAQAERNAALTATAEPAAPDRTLALALSLALLAAGIALFVANRVLRRRAGI